MDFCHFVGCIILIFNEEKIISLAFSFSNRWTVARLAPFGQQRINATHAFNNEGIDSSE
jgi:hypothetical protein